MKSKFFTSLLLASVVVTNTFADDKPANPPSPFTEAEMQAMMKASTPGEEHKRLEQYVGKWNYTSKWWKDAKSKPEESTGTSEIESILGGRYIHQRVNGTSMGQPFEGLGLTGYDNVAKHYSTLWIDNMGTTMVTGTGKFDTAKNAIIDKGSFSCPMSKSGKMSYRAVWSAPERDSFKYEMFSAGKDGKEYRMMEMVYTKTQ